MADPTVLKTLESVFGFSALRAGQEAVIDKLIGGQSVLAIFPTGAGKSLCYQLPALLLEGVTVVVSPLIALMKDQIDFLVSRGIKAARLDSTLEADDARQVYRDLYDGSLKLLYVAPERLGSERFLQTLKRLSIPLLAVDEAHCISEWGHNFRPDYMKLAGLAKELNVGRVLALTATATPSVEGQIAAGFNVASDDVVRTPFHRPNLELRVSPCTLAERDAVLLKKIQSQPRGPTIVYVTLQKTAEAVANRLIEAGLPAEAYHAGLGAEERHAVQDRFMSSGDSIVVATIAFGMGIDKADIRYVYHYNVPKSPENYAQEIGRAGRDGKPSVCEMLPAMADVTVLENFTFGDTPDAESVRGLLDLVLRTYPSVGPSFDLSVYELSNSFDIRQLVVETLLTYLQLDGILQSTGPFYTEYKLQTLKPLPQIIAKFDPRRQEFLRKLFAHAKLGKTWLTLNIVSAEQDLQTARERIVAALNYLEEQGDVKLQVAGVRQGFRVLRTLKMAEHDALAEEMIERFADRERRDVERLAEVLKFATHEGCRTQYLLRYFGEGLEHDCGHCDWCAGVKPAPIPPVEMRKLGANAQASLRALRAEGNESLASPRQIARFLCGINSPAVSRARLQRHPKFGALASVPFREVLAFAETA